MISANLFAFLNYRSISIILSDYLRVKNTKASKANTTYKTKKAPYISMGLRKSGVDLLSHPQKGSTISASSLNFSVRKGKRWTLLP